MKGQAEYPETKSNKLSRGIGQLPMWLVQAFVAVILTGCITWVTWASVQGWNQEVRLKVVETQIDNVHSDIVEIKDGQKEIIKKLDELRFERRK